MTDRRVPHFLGRCPEDAGKHTRPAHVRERGPFASAGFTPQWRAFLALYPPPLWRAPIQLSEGDETTCNSSCRVVSAVSMCVWLRATQFERPAPAAIARSREGTLAAKRLRLARVLSSGHHWQPSTARARNQPPCSNE